MQKFFKLFIVYLGCDLITCHSWLDLVGNDGGRMRGYKVGETDDHKLQRYICDKHDLNECQPPAKHGITLNEDSLIPCRIGRSPVITNVKTGGMLYLKWMGNGHANEQSFKYPVDVYITPFKERLAFTDFTPLSLNIPYFYCEDGKSTCDRPYTDALIKLQDKGRTLAPGLYTILWKWHFGPFTFGSCADVLLQDKISGLSTVRPPTSKPVTKTPALTVHGTLSYLEHGCHFDSECHGVGKEYCKLWQKDICGRSVCHGSNLHLKLCTRPGKLVTTAKTLPTGTCGNGSYCMCFKTPPVCHHKNTPCSCDIIG